MMTRKIPPFFAASASPLLIATLHLLFAIFTISADAALTVNVRDRGGNPLSSVNVQIFPGTLDPDGNVEPVKPPQPRGDGLVGFVTNQQGRVTLDLPAGQYSVVAFSSSSGRVNESFLIVREMRAPGEVTLSIAETVPVAVEAIGESDFSRQPEPLVGARVAFRPSQRALGFVGLLNNDGKLQTAISPGRYHVVIKGSIALHYVVLANQIVTSPNTTIRFDGTVQSTAELKLELPPTTGLALYEILATNISQEFVDIVENSIGYDAAYTEAYSLAFDQNASPMRLLPGLTYQLNLSYVVDLDGILYAYELRINALRVNTPGTHLIGNSGAQPFTLTARTDENQYRPGDLVTVHYEIFDTRGNQLYRFFNFSGARLIFPFVVVRDPNGVVVGSNPITSELPEDFFRFAFRLPPSAQPGIYTVNVSLDAKMYGQLTDGFNFRVVSETDNTPPRISNVNAPTTAEANTSIRISAQIEDESGVNSLTLDLLRQESSPPLLGEGPGERFGDNLVPAPLPNNRYEWEIPVGTTLSALLRWQITAVDAFGNESTAAGEIEIRDTTPPTLAHTPIGAAEVGMELPITAAAADNVGVTEVIVSYRNGQMDEFASLRAWVIRQFGDSQEYTAAISASALTGDSLQYFLRARDSVGNSRRLPADGEFAVQLRDTTPPIIYHTPVSTSTGEPIRIDAVVIDNGTVEEVELNYRQIGEGDFMRLPMTPIANTYTATMPASTTAYFLDARDRDGNRARLPAESGDYQIQQELRPRIAQLDLFLASSAESPLKITVGSMQPFQFRALDAMGRIVPTLAIWSVTNGIGEIDQDGRFYAATQSGRSGQVIATIPTLDESAGDRPSAMQAIAWMELLPARTEQIAIRPHGDAFTPIQLAAGARQPFRAFVLDGYGNPRTDSVIWRVEGGIGEMIGDSLHAQSVGSGRVVATAGRLSASAEVEVSFGELTRIEIRPTTLNMRTGEEQRLSATGLDASGNRVLIAPIWSVRGGVGRIRTATFTAGR
ncbi:MAG: hypothetical protein O7E52_29880, partial [Candidatus Poribacteria bacterium]|nr:hypothetical protein [Candidatus Poribacteria bacterium]